MSYIVQTCQKLSKFVQNYPNGSTIIYLSLISELEAYSSVLSALRAQGELTKERRKVMNDLSNVLNIPIERHKAEVRRAINEELLNTIAAR